jgi:TRAP-type uncharacterized transport system substrate-binding protein
MKKLMMVAVFFGLAMSAQAAKMEGAPTACEGLKVATGPVGKGYSKMFKNIVDVSGKEIAVCEVNTDGGLDNTDVLSGKRADVGIIPLDTLIQLAPSDPSIAGLQVVATLNSNFLHIVASARPLKIVGPKKMMFMEGDTKLIQISKLSDLRGAPVALVGSAQLLVRQLDKQLGLKMQYIDVNGATADEDAFKMVQTGRVYASFTVAGWPHGKVVKLSQNSGLTLLPFDMPVNGPYIVRPYRYTNLGQYNVPALGVQNLLMTRPFTGEKVAEVAKLKRALVEALPKLKDGEYEPAWNEIVSLDGKVDWAKFQGDKAPVFEKTARK